MARPNDPDSPHVTTAGTVIVNGGYLSTPTVTVADVLGAEALLDQFLAMRARVADGAYQYAGRLAALREEVVRHLATIQAMSRTGAYDPQEMSEADFDYQRRLGSSYDAAVARDLLARLDA